MSANAARTPWLVPELQMFPLAARRCLVRNRLTGASIELSSGEYGVLSACEGCAPLAEHEARAAQRLSAPQEHRSAIRELLERCARDGLLIPLSELVARFGAADATPREPIAGISIPTADRPQLLLRLLTGAAALQRRTGMAYCWHVFDDSRSDASRRANREAIARCPELDLVYHDLSAADALESVLAAALPDLAREIHSLLAAARPGERTYGRARNYPLLWFAGRCFLSIDDDAVVDPRQPPLARDGVNIGVASKAVHWYDTFDGALAACPRLPIDPFAEHARWLGLSMAEAWRLAEGEPGGLRLGPLPGAAAAHFDPAARIVFTWNHVLGDPGWPQFSSGQLALGAETRAWLAANPDAARSAFESQVHWRGDSSLQLAPQRTLGTTTLTGFDGSVLLPPAVRVEVGSDTMIGELTRCIHPAAWNASLPFALPHVREARRQWLAPTETLAPSVNTALIAYARGCAGSIRAQDPAARLRALGDSFVDLSAASDAKLGTLIVEQRAASASWRAYAVNEQLHDATTPETWKQVLRQWLGSPLLRLDAATLRQQTLPLDALRSRAREFGRALIAWPRLWAWCRENPQ